MRAAILAVTMFATIFPASAQQQVPKDTSINLTNEDIDVIWGALAELPYKRAAPVMAKIKDQWQAQQPKPAAPSQPAADAPK